MTVSIQPASPKLSWRLVGWSFLALLLCIPAFGMLLTEEVNWGPGDFVVAGGLFAALGVAFELVYAKSRTAWVRRGMIAAAIFVFLAVWAELAVGIF